MCGPPSSVIVTAFLHTPIAEYGAPLGVRLILKTKPCSAASTAMNPVCLLQESRQSVEQAEPCNNLVYTCTIWRQQFVNTVHNHTIPNQQTSSFLCLYTSAAAHSMSWSSCRRLNKHQTHRHNIPAAATVLHNARCNDMRCWPVSHTCTTTAWWRRARRPAHLIHNKHTSSTWQAPFAQAAMHRLPYNCCKRHKAQGYTRHIKAGRLQQHLRKT